jgi:hypothetical protein
LSGLKKVVADFLSRPLLKLTETVTATATEDPVNFEEMATEQNRCAEMQLIPQISFPPDRRPMQLTTFQQAFSPNCPPQVQKGYFFTFSQCCSPQEACIPWYCFI